MKGKNLLILLVVTAVLIAVAIFSSREKTLPSASVIGKKLLPDLDVNEITTVCVRSTSETATLKRTEDGWVSVESYNYPVDFDKLRKALLSLADIKIGQAVNVDDAMRDELRMHPPHGGDKPAGTLVELQGKGGALASVLLGEERQSRPADNAGPYGGSYPEGQYVSTDAGKTVFLLAKSLNDFSTDRKQWMDTDLLNVGQYDLAKIVLADAEGKKLVISRPDDGGALTIEGMADTEEAESSKVTSISSALSWLRFDDVADPALTDEELGFNRPAVATYETKKGEIYTVRIGGSPADTTDRYIRLAAAFVPPDEPEEKPTDTEDEDAAKKHQDELKKKAEEREKLAEKIAAFNKRCEGWTYIVASSKAANLTATRKDAVKPKEKKEEEKKEDNTGAAPDRKTADGKD
jgi:hypothetical protein